MADEQTFTTGGLTVGQLRNLRPGTITPPEPPPRRKLGALQELVRAPQALAGSAIAGVGQLAADTPFAEQGNVLQRVGQGIQERNASDIQGFSDIAERPTAAAGAMAGSLLGSVAAFKAPRVLGTALTALSVPAAFVPYAGPALSTILRGAGTALRVGGTAGAALGTASSLGTMAAAQYAQDRQEQIAQDPANAESLGAKAAAGANALVSGLIESRLGVEAGLGRTMLGKTLLDEVGSGTRRQLIGRGALKYGSVEALEEAAQAVGSQLATFKNPLTADSLEDTAFQAVMGLGAGGMFGAVRGAIANPGMVSDDDLKNTIDPVLTPEPPPVLALPAPPAFVGNAEGEVWQYGQPEALAALIAQQRAEFEAQPRALPAPPAFIGNAEGEVWQYGWPEAVAERAAQQRAAIAAAPLALPAPPAFVGNAAGVLSRPGQNVEQQQALAAIEARAADLEADGQVEAAITLRDRARKLLTPQGSAQPEAAPPSVFRVAVASNPSIPLKGVPSALRKSLDSAATPEELADVITREYHARAERSNASYVHDPDGLLQSLYRTVTGGQTIPTQAELAAQAQAQAQSQIVPLQPQQETPSAQAVRGDQRQVNLTGRGQEGSRGARGGDLQQPAQAGPAAGIGQAQGIEPLGQVVAPPQRLTKAQERQRDAARSALVASEQAADDALMQLMDDALPKSKRVQAEATIRRAEKMRAEFDAKYGPQASRRIQPAIPDRITVNGIERHTRNSSGQLIHPTEEGIRNFWRWFGDSKVVDEQGRPLVVYHGTRGNFSAFDPARIGQSDYGSVGRGFYFSQDPGTANVYATLAPGDAVPNIIPAYLQINSPSNYDELPNIDTEGRSLAVTKNLVDIGYDGIIKYGRDGAMDEIVVFRPEQIKSATGNTGAFSPTTTDITASRTAGQSSGRTVSEVEAEIKQRLGSSGWTRLRNRFAVVADTDALRADMQRRGSRHADAVDDNVKGLYDPSTETSYIVAGNMAATDSPWGVFLHEVGTHYGLRRMLGAKGHAAVLRDVARLIETGDAAMLAAARQANVAEQIGLDPEAPDFAARFGAQVRGDARLGEEVVGYFAESPANHNRSVWKRIVTAVRKFLRSLGISRPLTADDIAVMVTAAARRASAADQQVPDDATVRRSGVAPTWYSQLARTLGTKLPARGPAEQMRAMVDGMQRKGDFKPEELEWSGLREWLAAQTGTVTREDILDVLAQNAIEVRDVVLGQPTFADLRIVEDGADKAFPFALMDGDIELNRFADKEAAEAEIRALDADPTTRRLYTRPDDEEGDRLPKFDRPDLKLPGGTNYREVLLTLPENTIEIELTPDQIAYSDFINRMEDEYGVNWRSSAPVEYRVRAEQLRSAAVQSRPYDPENQNALVSVRQDRANFQSAHFPDTPNILAHVRLNDRIDDQGRRILFVEEVQRDYSIELRRRAEKQAFLARFLPGTPEFKQKVDELVKDPVALGLPVLPFQSQSAWTMLAMKRVLRMAVDGGYDGVAWITGKQTQDRYDLSRHIGTIGYQKRGDLFNVTVWGVNDGPILMQSQSATLQDVEDFVGKDIASQMADGKGDEQGGVKYLDGLDLKIGGEWAVNLYDKQIPNDLNKYVKKWGGRVGTTMLDTGKGKTAQHMLEITDAMRTAISAGQPLFSRSSATGPVSADTRETLNQYGQVVNALRGRSARAMAAMTKTGRDTISAKALRIAARWADREHLVEMYDDRFDGALRRNAATYANQEVIASRFNQLFNNVYHKLEALERSNPKAYAEITKLMTATELQIDPRKPWQDQKHLHALPDDEQVIVKRHVTNFRQSWGKLAAEHRQIYNDLVDMNEMMFAADMAVTLQNVAQANIPEGGVPEALRADITEAFRNRPETHESIAAAKKYWMGELDRYAKAVAEYAAAQRVNIPITAPQTPELKAATAAALKGIPPGPAREKIKRDLARGRMAELTADQKRIVQHLSPLEAQLKIIAAGKESIARAPYFHLGRFGDYFVSTRVRLAENGKADPAAMRQVAEILGKAFPEVHVRADATDAAIVARFESADTAQSFVNTLKKLQAQGLLQRDIEEAAYIKGVQSQVKGKAVTPEWLTQAIESIHAEDYGDGDEGRRIADQLIANLRRMYLESLPDLSTAKVMAHRTGRQGYNTDMVRSFAHRTRVASTHIAGIAVSPARRASMKQVRAIQYAAQASPDVTLDEQNKLGIIADEFRQREIDLESMPQTPGLALMRAASHTFFLAMSPAYMLLNVSQVGTVAWPELTKRFGAVKSFNALVRAAPIAGKVIRAAITEGYKARGVRGALDAVVTSDILKAAGIPADVAGYLIEMMGTGKLDIGNATRELARVAEGEVGGPNSERVSEALRLATSTSYMSEIFSRTIVALAARDLHGSDGAVPYAARVLDQAMLNYNFTNLGRATGKKGVFGEVTPVVMQFHQYQFQMLAKLYREIYRGSGLGAGVTPEQQAEARQFLKSHAAAVTLLAGTMGLPFMTVAARLSDMLCEMFSDQPCDTKASLRNFTSDIVGEDIEPLVSRGLPRLLDIDVSDRAGEADLLPGSRFLADRRTLAEKMKDPSIAISGASGSMFASMIEGMQMMADGDWLGGAQRALPLAIQGPIKAYQLGTQGFVDRNQNQLPMTPHAREILAQLLGFQPGQKADYSQAVRSQQQRTAILTREGAVIRRNLAVAFERGDREAMLEWARRAEEYRQRNPGLDILPGLRSAIRQRERARALGTVGVLPGMRLQDVGAFEATRFFQPNAVQ